MTKLSRSVSFLGALLALGLPAAPAHAQLARTFVSAASGNDSNDCNRLTPCRTFQRAHNNTLAAGEITVLDAGGYGGVTITKAISIINDGVGEAGALVSGGANGITINAGASDPVSLRGLTVKGIGFGGGNGIVFTSGRSLTVENCAIRNLTGALPIGNGIVFQPSVSSRLAVSNTVVADNDMIGIYVTPAGAGLAVSAAFSRVEAYNNDTGFDISGVTATGTLNATVADSVAAGNANAGIFAVSGPGVAEATSVMVVRSVSANNGIGLAASVIVSGNVILRVGRSTVTGNLTSWSANPGAFLRSYGDNNIDGNSDGDPSPTTILMK
jgi:hypothetical protein